jgi:two-component system CheB/CheR fusion protein
VTQPDPAFEALLEHLKASRGFDFTGYKRSSLMRRVDRRMAQVGATSYADYLDHLELHGDEFTALFNTILINVTGFFRDVEAWDYLRRDVLPTLIAAKNSGRQLRLWSAGCASGEEAYTLAMVLAELLGPAEFRDRVKIYATDVDEDALAYARHGSYTEREVRGVPPELLDRYFDLVGGRYVVRKDLRRSVIFGRNDLVQDAPISRVDVLVCRNTLMYFTAETQSRILTRFHFALGPAGILLLGKAEMLLSHGSLFAPVDLRRRVFQKAARADQPQGMMVGEIQYPAARPELTGLDALRHEALLATPLAQVVVTADGLVALVNRQAEQMFGLSARDIGRPFRDLEVSYRPVELRRHLEQAQAERRTVRITDVSFPGGGQNASLEVEVTPLVSAANEVLGAAVTVTDVTAFRRLQDELEQANRQLETAYEELQSTNEELETTNEELQSTVEELETTNEELQSTNEELETMNEELQSTNEELETTNEELQSTVEELETTNEELQSTNEELETMNEELQSTNDELQTINDELQDRTGELDAANGFLEAILTSLRAGVVVLNPELHVRVWNRQAQELWGLRPDEVLGQHFLNLDIGLPTDQLRSLIRRTLAGEGGPQEETVDAVNRRGRSIEVRVLGSALTRGAETAGIILTMENVDDRPVDDAAGAAAVGGVE